MNAVKIEVELPADLVLALNVETGDLARRAREWIVLQLFQEGLISSGRAAEILGRSKAGFLDLLDQHGLPYLDDSRRDLESQLGVALRASGAEREEDQA